jgi:hypothetical protein
VDDRHSVVEAKIKELHLAKFALAAQWDGSEGRALKQLLQANKTWTIAQLTTMISNRFASEGITGERPRAWLSNLGRYAGGPLDRFGKLTSAPMRPSRSDDGRDYSNPCYMRVLQEHGIYNVKPVAAHFEPGGLLFEYEQKAMQAHERKQ